jgi:hypothetical protein
MKCSLLHQAFPSGISRGVQSHPVCGLFRNHQCGAVGVAAGDGGHDAGIDHAQTSDASHLKLTVDHRHGVIIAAHAGCTDGVKNGAGNVARQLGQFFIRLVLHTRLELFWFVPRHGSLRHDATRHAQTVGCYFAVCIGAEVIGCNGRCVVEVRALQSDAAAAGGCLLYTSDAADEG